MLSTLDIEVVEVAKPPQAFVVIGIVTVHGKIVGDNSVGWVELTKPWWVGAFYLRAACEIPEVKTLSDDPPPLLAMAKEH